MVSFGEERRGREAEKKRSATSEERFDVISDLISGLVQRGSGLIVNGIDRSGVESAAAQHGLDFAAMFDVFGFEHVLVVAQQPTGRQDRLGHQAADIEETVELDGRRRRIAQLRQDHGTGHADGRAVGGRRRLDPVERLAPLGPVAAGTILELIIRLVVRDGTLMMMALRCALQGFDGRFLAGRNQWRWRRRVHFDRWTVISCVHLVTGHLAARTLLRDLVQMQLLFFQTVHQVELFEIVRQIHLVVVATGAAAVAAAAAAVVLAAGRWRQDGLVDCRHR